MADYDRLTEKLEKSIGEARSASEAARKEAAESAEAVAALKGPTIYDVRKILGCFLHVF